MENTDTQLVTYAYLVFQKSGTFMNSLKEWNARSHVNKAFVNFKMFMRQQYLDLQAVGGLTLTTFLLNIDPNLRTMDWKDNTMNAML